MAAKKAATGTTKKKTTKKKAATKKAPSTAKKTSAAKPRKSTGKKAALAGAALAKPVALTYDEISLRAFQLWESKGKPVGMDDINWKEAEAQLKAERGL